MLKKFKEIKSDLIIKINYTLPKHLSELIATYIGVCFSEIEMEVNKKLNDIDMDKKNLEQRLKNSEENRDNSKKNLENIRKNEIEKDKEILNLKEQLKLEKEKNFELQDSLKQLGIMNDQPKEIIEESPEKKEKKRYKK